jgi:F5/8 type C domain
MPGLNDRRRGAPLPRDRWTLGRRVATTLLVLALLMLAACGTSPSPTLETSPTPRPGDVGWEVVGRGSLPAQTAMPVDVTARDGIVVMVGLGANQPRAEGTTSALPIWSSTQGGLWTQATVEGTASGSPASVVAFDKGFVAVGSDQCSPTLYGLTMQDCEPAIWRSTDGVEWSRVALDAPPNTQLTAVITWNDGLLAVGGRLLGAGSTGAQGPVLLRSADGTTWEQVNPNDTLDGPLTDVASDGETLIAVGVRGGTGRAQAAAWSSQDGIAWTRETLAGVSAGAQWVSVSSLPGGFGAVSIQLSSGETFSRSVSRRDTSWHALSGVTEIGSVRLMSIASGPFGGIVVGMDESYRPVLFASQDGAAWGPVSPVGEMPTERFVLVSATWADGRFLVSGIDLATYQPMVLAGMAYVPRPGEIAYVTPAPTPTPTPGPTPMPPAMNAVGLANLSLKSIDNYSPPHLGPAQCVSGYGAQSLSEVTIYDAGTVAGAPTHATLTFLSSPVEGSAAQMVVTAFPLGNGGEQQRSWSLAGTVATVGADGLTGTVALDNGGGSVQWMCGAWFDPSVQAPFEGNYGDLTLKTRTAGWTPSAAQATCLLEPDGSIGGVMGVVGSLKGGVTMTVNLPLNSRSLVGEHLAVAVADTASRLSAQALVTLTAVGYNDLAGAGTFSLRFTSPVEGWPQRLDGTLSWRCPGRTDTDEKPMAACPLPSSPPVGANLAAGKESTASATHPRAERVYAFDGDPTSAWSSGLNAMQWIEVDLGKPVQVGELRLLAAMGSDSGHMEQTVYGRTEPDGPLVKLAVCGGYTVDNQWLVMTVNPRATPVRYLRIETTASSAWVGWREIEVYAAS